MLRVNSNPGQVSKAVTIAIFGPVILLFIALGIVIGYVLFSPEIYDTPESARFLGKVVDESDSNVQAATVYTLRQANGDTLGFGETDTRGEFNFIVKMKPENAVYVIMSKDGKTSEHGFETLSGNKILTFR